MLEIIIVVLFLYFFHPKTQNYVFQMMENGMEPIFVYEEYYPSSSEEDPTESVTNPVLQQLNVFAQLQDPAPRTITEPEDVKYKFWNMVLKGNLIC